MNKDQIVQALMFFNSHAKWSFTPGVNSSQINYSNIVWEDLFYIKPTEAELQQYYEDSQVAYQTEEFYKTKRQQAYPSVEEQLDMIFHDGIDVWKQRIQNIKDNIPKPKA
jgi:hypothetical protein